MKRALSLRTLREETNELVNRMARWITDARCRAPRDEENTALTGFLQDEPLRTPPKDSSIRLADQPRTFASPANASGAKPRLGTTVAPATGVTRAVDRCRRKFENGLGKMLGAIGSATTSPRVSLHAGDGHQYTPASSQENEEFDPTSRTAGISGSLGPEGLALPRVRIEIGLAQSPGAIQSSHARKQRASTEGKNPDQPTSREEHACGERPRQ